MTVNFQHLQTPQEAQKNIAVKHDKGKLPLSQVPPCLNNSAARAFQFGGEKYSPYNWAQGEGIGKQRLLDSLLRHLAAFNEGEKHDKESNLCHLDCAAATLAMLIATHRGILHRCRGIDSNGR
jgi:transposase-like protein